MCEKNKTSHLLFSINAKVHPCKKIQPLFTLGSVYSSSASGAEQTTETNNSKMNIKKLISFHSNYASLLRRHSLGMSRNLPGRKIA